MSSRIMLLLVMIALGCAGLNVFATPVAHAATQAQTCNKGFFGLAPWYEYLSDKLTASCEVKCFNFTDQDASTPATQKCGDGKSDVPFVLLAVVDSLLRIAALATIGYVIYGAFQYVGSQGDPEAAARAQRTIMNALVGVVLAIAAVSIVSFLGKKLGG